MGGHHHLSPQMKNAAWLSIVVSLFLFACKFAAYRLTSSQAIFSDAIESIVNIFTALTAFWVIHYAVKPADKDHPYGHGKVEYLSAILEGVLISFASVVIIMQVVQAYLEGKPVTSLIEGLALIGFAGVINLLLGLYLIKVGKTKNSVALEASGKHVIADFWTSAAVIFGLILVSLTKIYWMDSVIAVLVSLHLLREGYKIVRKSIGGLLDEEEVPVLERMRELILKNPKEGIIQVHHLRVLRSGQYHHVDAHVVVPEFWSVEEAHDQTHSYEKLIFNQYEYVGEFHFHIDPCRKLYCQFCDLEDCPVRKEKFVKRREMTLKELTDQDEPF